MIHELTRLTNFSIVAFAWHSLSQIVESRIDVLDPSTFSCVASSYTCATFCGSCRFWVFDKHWESWRIQSLSSKAVFDNRWLAPRLHDFYSFLKQFPYRV